MESIKRLTGTALEATASGCVLTLRTDKDGSEIGTVYYLRTNLELLEKLQKLQVGFMEIVGEELDIFKFDDHSDGRITLRIHTKGGYSIDTEMTDVAERMPAVVPDW